MKRKEFDGRGRGDGDSGQMILLAAFIMAVILVGMAAVVGSAFFSQNTQEDPGVSQLTTQVSDQMTSAEETGLQVVDFVSENATQTQGRNQTEICQDIIDNTRLEQIAAEQLEEEEVILDIELVGDCEDFQGLQTFLTAQQNSSNLPGVEVADPVDEVHQCANMHDDTGYPSNIDEFVSELKDVYSSPVPSDPDPGKMAEALVNAANIDTDALPGGITVEDYAAECIEVEITEGRNPADVVFAIDTTGSMAQGSSVTEDWETPPHGGTWPREIYRPETDVPLVGDYDPWNVPSLNIPYSEVEVECHPEGSSGSDCNEWEDGSQGDMVYVEEDDGGPWGGGGDGYMAMVSSDDPTGTEEVCVEENWWGNCVEYEESDLWEVDTREGGTEEVPELDMYEVEYRLNTYERMWYTVQGMIAATQDLNATEPDRAGLVEYDYAGRYSTAGGSGSAAVVRETVAGVHDPDHRQSIIDSSAELLPGGGTNIAAGLREARAEVEDRYNDGPEASPRATKNVVLMTDGQHSDGRYDDAHQEVEDNDHLYEDVFVHSVILGSAAADNEDAVEDMGRIANDPDPNLANANVDQDDLPDWENINAGNRPNGTLIASDDPADAEGIFEDIIGTIEDETEFEEPTSNETDGEVEVSASSGGVGAIYDLGMNLTSYSGNGSYVMGLTDEAADGSEIKIWEFEFNNQPVDEDGDVVHENQVIFRSDQNPDLDAVYNGTTQLVEGEGDHVRIDLPNQEFEMTASASGEDPASYPMDEAWETVSDYVEPADQSVALEAEDTDLQSEANGTFSFEFEPLDGNFTKHVGNSSIDLGDDCDPNVDPDEIPTCGVEDPGNQRGAVSTVQVRSAMFEVTVEGPSGRSTREIEVDMNNLTTP